jgi:hypothetical protein
MIFSQALDRGRTEGCMNLLYLICNLTASRNIQETAAVQSISTTDMQEVVNVYK